MKTSVARLFKSKLVQAGGLLAVIAAIAASSAWSEHPEGPVKLGGTWVGKLGDITWIGTQSPDSSGQNAMVTLQWITMSAEFQELFGVLGADHSSIASGFYKMVSPDIAKGKIIWYLYAEGMPSKTAPVPGQIKAVGVMANEFHFTSPTAALGNHELKLYFADPQNPMVPNEAYLFLDQTYDNTPHVKIF